VTAEAEEATRNTDEAGGVKSKRTDPTVPNLFKDVIDAWNGPVKPKLTKESFVLTTETSHKLLTMTKYARKHAQMITEYIISADRDEQKYVTHGHFTDTLNDSEALLIFMLKDAINQPFICLDAAIVILHGVITPDRQMN
jgi:hypothetical protein